MLDNSLLKTSADMSSHWHYQEETSIQSKLLLNKALKINMDASSRIMMINDYTLASKRRSSLSIREDLLCAPNKKIVADYPPTSTCQHYLPFASKEDMKIGECRADETSSHSGSSIEPFCASILTTTERNSVDLPSIYRGKTVPNTSPKLANLTSIASNDIGSNGSTPKSAIVTKTEKPAVILKSIIASASTSFTDLDIASETSSLFSKPTEEQIVSYDAIKTSAVRSGDISTLRSLMEAGQDLSCCNRFGESLLHMACRRGKTDVVRFLLQEANVSPMIRDDYGKTPYHDACWLPSANYELMELLIQKGDPRVLLTNDVRGHTPFDYARKEQWAGWNEFLQSRKDLILLRLGELSTQA